MQLPERVPEINLAAAVRTVTRNPAVAVGLDDRGEIAKGLRADVIQVHMRMKCPPFEACGDRDVAWHDGRTAPCRSKA